jgi:hypothetical protein
MASAVAVAAVGGDAAAAGVAASEGFAFRDDGNATHAGAVTTTAIAASSARMGAAKLRAYVARGRRPIRHDDRLVAR